jgi:hypothetical protein
MDSCQVFRSPEYDLYFVQRSKTISMSRPLSITTQKEPARPQFFKTKTEAAKSQRFSHVQIQIIKKFSYCLTA